MAVSDTCESASDVLTVTIECVMSVRLSLLTMTNPNQMHEVQIEQEV